MCAVALAARVETAAAGVVWYRYGIPQYLGGRAATTPSQLHAISAKETYSLRRLFRLRLVGPVPQPILEQSNVHLLGEFAL